ncbi:MAG: glycosyltransferase [Flaviramulus sp.]|nr:glycosyltransferase [Flaviramulus sp.]
MLSKKSPLFSIIIPTYDSGSTLSVALDSIFNQTFTDLEVLVIDGLSSDKTLDIVKNYKNKFNNIRIYSENDQGIYDAMNKGIDLAMGEWLFFMGSDDFFYETTTLEKLLKYTDVEDNTVLYGSVYSTRFNGIYDGEFTYSKLTKKNICHQSMFFNKKIFKMIGKFNLKYVSHADWDHNFRCFFSSKVKCIYVNQIIANYADGGFSSLNQDHIFNNDKFFKIINLGVGKLTFQELITDCNEAISLYKKQKDYFKLCVAYILKYSFKILAKI